MLSMVFAYYQFAFLLLSMFTGAPFSPNVLKFYISANAKLFFPILIVAQLIKIVNSFCVFFVELIKKHYYLIRGRSKLTLKPTALLQVNQKSPDICMDIR